MLDKKVFYLLPENQLLKEGLEKMDILYTYQSVWRNDTYDTINFLYKMAVENLTCAMLLGEEAAILPLAQLYYSGTIYNILPDLVFGDYIILAGKKLEYITCKDIPLRIIANTKYFEKQLDTLAITIISNMLFYYSNFTCIGDDIKKNY